MDDDLQLLLTTIWCQTEISRSTQNFRENATEITHERDSVSYLMGKQTRAKQTYAMAKEATNGRYSANRSDAPGG